MLCDTPLERAEAMAGQLGFARATDDWRALVADPEVELVSITTPNRLHREMALAALAAGKHVWCEKPLALTLGEAEEMAAAAEAAGVATMVGYNYLRNPAFAHAQRLVEDGAIGRVVHFRGFVDEDYQADPELPWTWRATARRRRGSGRSGISAATWSAWPAGWSGRSRAWWRRWRPCTRPGRWRTGAGGAAVENEDVASALVRFAGGVTGVLDDLAQRPGGGRTGSGGRCTATGG